MHGPNGEELGAAWCGESLRARVPNHPSPCACGHQNGKKMKNILQQKIGIEAASVSAMTRLSGVDCAPERLESFVILCIEEGGTAREVESSMPASLGER